MHSVANALWFYGYLFGLMFGDWKPICGFDFWCLRSKHIKGYGTRNISRLGKARNNLQTDVLEKVPSIILYINILLASVVRSQLQRLRLWAEHNMLSKVIGGWKADEAGRFRPGLFRRYQDFIIQHCLYVQTWCGDTDYFRWKQQCFISVTPFLKRVDFL